MAGERVWQEILPAQYGEKATAEVVKAVDQRIETYSRVLAQGLGPFKRDIALVEAAREKLQQLPYPERIYGRVQREIMREYKPEPLTLTSLLQGEKQTLLETKKRDPRLFYAKIRQRSV